MKALIPVGVIEKKIYLIRGYKVMTPDVNSGHEMVFHAATCFA